MPPTSSDPTAHTWMKTTEHPVDHPIIGVLGGMGPEATVDLMRRVIAATPARDDQDHIHMIVDNNPKVPSRIAALIHGTGQDPAPAIMAMARGLEHSGANILAMPCNTAHVYLDNIRQVTSIPILDMVGLTAQRVGAMTPRPKRIGILASTAVNQSGLYEGALASHLMTMVIPEQQEQLMDIIMAVKRGDNDSTTSDLFGTIVGELRTSGVDVLLVACTELSVMAGDLNTNIPVIDALDVLTEAIVAFARPVAEPVT